MSRTQNWEPRGGNLGWKLAGSWTLRPETFGRRRTKAQTRFKTSGVMQGARGTRRLLCISAPDRNFKFAFSRSLCLVRPSLITQLSTNNSFTT